VGLGFADDVVRRDHVVCAQLESKRLVLHRLEIGSVANDNSRGLATELMELHIEEENSATKTQYE
jgi:hypothetical protein